MGCPVLLPVPAPVDGGLGIPPPEFELDETGVTSYPPRPLGGVAAAIEGLGGGLGS